MLIVVNGETKVCESGNLGTLWRHETEHLAPPSRRGFAMALNGEVVREPAWNGTDLKDGDRVEIIRAFAGG